MRRAFYGQGQTARYVGLSTTELIFPSPGTSSGEVALGLSGKPGETPRSDSADIYTGGEVPNVGDSAVDAGLTLMTSDPAIDPAWGPIIHNVYDNPKTKRRPGLVIPARPMGAIVNGNPIQANQRILLYGDSSYPLLMSFETGGQGPTKLQNQAVLHFKGKYKLVTREIDKTTNNRKILNPNAVTQVGSITLTGWAPSWTYKNGRTMIIKRASSIAQNIADNQAWMANSSHLYGCAWGIGQSGYPSTMSNHEEGQLLSYQAGYVDWDASVTWRAGTSPPDNKQVVYFSANIPFYAERYINLSTSPDVTLPVRR